MLKKLLSAAAVCALVALGQSAHAQQYKSGVGLRLDLGEGSTLVGPAFKHFFNNHSAGEFSLLFGGNTTMLGAEYQYHGAIPNAGGLQWYAGAGGSLGFFKVGPFKQTNFWLRPLVGLDYKLGATPLAVGFDWRPMIRLTNTEGGGTFTAARFGLAARYTF
ncbi:hypothetical protein [Flaviaesturariibacter amylovorans]|uniref:Outer membrane protein beta-barrel domain-containing protein n=1 Tax=Flaviaesturariibacter amylovorans TaxID=1084520 RepID=A0ABP8GF28_9BACT